MRRYFGDRRDKAFTVVQTVALAEHRFDKPNAFGHFPIEPKQPNKPIVKDRPDNDYWDHVERVLRLAAEHGLDASPLLGLFNWEPLLDGFPRLPLNLQLGKGGV